MLLMVAANLRTSTSPNISTPSSKKTTFKILKFVRFIPVASKLRSSDKCLEMIKNAPNAVSMSFARLVQLSVVRILCKELRPRLIAHLSILTSWNLELIMPNVLFTRKYCLKTGRRMLKLFGQNQKKWLRNFKNESD